MTTNGIEGKRRLIAAVVVVAAFITAFIMVVFLRLSPELRKPAKLHPAFQLVPPIELASLPTAVRFDYPLGSEHGAMTYNAQPFTTDRHLGDDLNGIGGENSDLGDPIYSIADGRVLLAGNGGPGWGNVIIVLHAYEEEGRRKYVQSYYAHVETILVSPNEDLHRGQQIATVGNAGGRYWAHLHFEMREFMTPFIGPGYRADTLGWINPSVFIATHRGASEYDVGRKPLTMP